MPEVWGAGNPLGIHKQTEIELRRNGADPLLRTVAVLAKPIVEITGINHPDEVFLIDLLLAKSSLPAKLLDDHVRAATRTFLRRRPCDRPKRKDVFGNRFLVKDVSRFASVNVGDDLVGRLVNRMESVSENFILLCREEPVVTFETPVYARGVPVDANQGTTERIVPSLPLHGKARLPQ